MFTQSPQPFNVSHYALPPFDVYSKKGTKYASKINDQNINLFTNVADLNNAQKKTIIHTMALSADPQGNALVSAGDTPQPKPKNTKNNFLTFLILGTIVVYIFS